MEPYPGPLYTNRPKNVPPLNSEFDKSAKKFNGLDNFPLFVVGKFHGFEQNISLDPRRQLQKENNKGKMEEKTMQDEEGMQDNDDEHSTSSINPKIVINSYEYDDNEDPMNMAREITTSIPTALKPPSIPSFFAYPGNDLNLSDKSPIRTQTQTITKKTKQVRHILMKRIIINRIHKSVEKSKVIGQPSFLRSFYNRSHFNGISRIRNSITHIGVHAYPVSPGPPG